MGVLLLVNAVLMGMSVNHKATMKSSEEAVPSAFRAMDFTFCIIFTVELVLRMAAHEEKFWYMDGWRWNVFDLIVVLFGWLDEVSAIFLTGTEIQAVTEHV